MRGIPAIPSSSGRPGRVNRSFSRRWLPNGCATSDGRFTRSLGDAAAQEAARTGGRIVDRELTIRPTLRVRPGAPVRVLVANDLTLSPYDQ